MTKIHIIGGSGSGKSFIAERLAKYFNIPVYDLDNIFWDKESAHYGKRNTIEKRDEMLSQILKRECWLIEGVYYGWLNQSFTEADYVFVIKSNVYIRDWRIIKRFVKRRLRIESTTKKETIKSLYQLIKWNHTYDRDNLTKALKMLKEHQDKVFVVKSNEEILKFFN
ncbi:MAG: DNA topology modulation protein FlaR [Bacillota bacterium]